MASSRNCPTASSSSRQVHSAKAATVAPMTTESRATFRPVTRLFFDHQVYWHDDVEIARGNLNADRVHADRGVIRATAAAAWHAAQRDGD